MKVGFTGTQQGMTNAQKSSLNMERLEKNYDGSSSNGRTGDFESPNWGSSP